MKRKFVGKLLAGILSFALLIPSTVNGAAPKETSAGQPENDLKQLVQQEATSKNAAVGQPIVKAQNQDFQSLGIWIASGNRWWYRHNDGSYTRNNWELIGGQWYYFDEEGWMVTGWRLVNGRWYYLDHSGKMLTGWQWVDGKCYFLEASGAMAEDAWIDGYYVNHSGAWEPGRRLPPPSWIKSGGRWWYRHGDGSYTSNGWEYINGLWYYFDESGWMVTGWRLVNGIWYYLDDSGKMLTGWQWIGGKCYFLQDSGAMAANTWIGEYYVDASGAWIPNQYREGWIESNGRWWYRHGDGSYTTSNWEMINGKQYYFDASGWMVTGWQKVNENWYYLGADGAMLTGWIDLGGQRFYLTEVGIMLTDWQNINNNWYYFNESGVLLTNTWVGDRYVDASGVWIETGRWAESNGRWYYINLDGTSPKSTWKTIEDKEYYFDAEGWRVTGWLQLSGVWYYLKEDGSKAYDYWVGPAGIGGYYVNKYGYMTVNQSYTLGNYMYSFDEIGICIGVEERYVWAVDPKNGKSYMLERQYLTDPQVGVQVTEDEFLAAAVYTEAGNQGMPGMTGVALVMLNRMNSSSYPSSAHFVIYQAGQFEVARNGTLTNWLNNKDSHILNDAKAAVQAARGIMNAYLTSGTPRTVEGLTMPAGKTDFDYEGFMTPAAFESVGLDWEKTEAFTYLNTTFYTRWIKKQG